MSLLPLTLVAAEDSLGWEPLLADRRASLTRADSIIDDLLQSRAPEVSWILPDRLRREARRAVGIAVSPDQMGTAVLRGGGESVRNVPDPLRTQLRTLVALAGGRFAVVPAALVYRRSGEAADRRSAPSAVQPTARPPDRRIANAELTVVLVDTRVGTVVWRTIARGDGDDPWTALTRAVKSLTPGLP